MDYKKISGSILLVLLLLPMTNALAFTYIDNIKDGNYTFFLIDLQIDENLEIHVTHTGTGNFTLFLFNTRPEQTYVNIDGTLNLIIFNNPPTVAYSLVDNPYVNYTAIEPKIYYIEVILVSGGPDTFTLTSTKDLTRYYLPIIPGFPLEFLLISLSFALTVVIILYKKKLRK
jgi:hypothetical protein